MRESRSKQKELLFKSHSIPVLYTKDINDPNVILWLKQTEKDLIINMRTRCIYKKSILEVPRLGCVNVHHGILPEQRGLFCDLYALADNMKAGFTIHKMTERIDGGHIFYQENFEKDKNYIDYLEKVSLREGIAIANFINQVTRKGVLPRGWSNKCSKPIITTTPSFKVIKQLQYKGMIL
jgi:methionyl-tRNA formyltransferase